MTSLKGIVRRIIALRARDVRITLLAVCPNSDAVLEAAVKVAAVNRMPMLFAATLNQVDRDGGYTGWTPRAFVARMRELATRHGCSAPLYPCLDHGGPWLKDVHTRDRLSLAETLAEVKATLTACLEAGYALLHVDPTVDRTLAPNQPPPIDVVVERTVELIAHAETERMRLGLPPVSYEVGTEEVHGGLVDWDNFDRFLTGLQARLEAAGLAHAWPCFIVGKVGTDLHTTTFDPQSARRLYERVAPLGSLVKGHYTDWVANPADYPATGMGGANVGPEFTATELAALHELCARESNLPGQSPSGFQEALRTAVLDSNRWQKWLLPDEVGRGFDELVPARQEWLVATGARYMWTDPRVMAARQRLYDHLRSELPDPHGFVVERIAQNVQVYVDAFNLKDSVEILAG
ncbi:MAG TPA: class II D-tagatose-bisphosphate aldolase, non-catalytic subunit [Anaerolineae bacterium]|nr:class II D-tagatose-bisphosphate aldolase, non-catalytic subunit [Anaerolineae bacterium]